MSYSIKPFIRTDKAVKKNGRYPIYFMIRLDKTLIKIPSGKEVAERHWDKKTCKVRGGGACQLLNTFLEKKLSGFNEFILTQENLEKEINKGNIKDFFRKRKPKQTFYQFWDDQVSLWQKIKRESTLMGYKYTLQILKLFSPNLNYNDINLDFIERFDNYLRTERNNSDGGVFGRHKCLKAMIKIAIRKGVMTKNPYVDFKVRGAEGKRMFLRLEEVKKLMGLYFSEDEIKLQCVSEMFLFACFTGLRFSDIIQLRWSNIDLLRRTLEIDMMKTNKPIQLPLIEPAMKILNQRKSQSGEASEEVFKTICNQYVNRRLKDLMKKAEIQKQITFHCARHTFACNHIESQTHMLVLKDLLGHSNVAQTEIYAKTLNVQMINAMKALENQYSNKLNTPPHKLRVVNE
ncbi:MAG: site-specific integrase [Bacteroidetes bacterium]|nr:site-specific integrase [Bacteroidota bacterium]